MKAAVMYTVVTSALFFAGCEPLPPILHVYPQSTSEELSSEDIQDVIRIMDMIGAEYHLYPIAHPFFGALRQYSESGKGDHVLMGVFRNEAPSYLSLRAGGPYEHAINRRLKQALQARFGKSRVRWVSELIFNPV